MLSLRFSSTSSKSSSAGSLVVRVYTDSAAWDTDHHCVALAINVESQEQVKKSESKSATSATSKRKVQLRRLIAKHIEKVMDTTPEGEAICDEISAEVTSLMTGIGTRLLGIDAPVETGL